MSSYKDILGTTATITTIGQFLSGMFTVQKILKQGQAGSLSPIPFVSGVVGCTLWLIYGQLKGDPKIINCNIVGTILNSFYVAVFMRYTRPSKTLLFKQVLSCLGFLTFVFIYVITCSSSGKSSGGGNEALKDEGVLDSLGSLCVVVTLLCCASPLVALKEVVRKKSTATLPFPLILSMFLVCSQWWAYGVLQEDFYMQFTNFLGSIIALIQLGLFCVFPNTDSSTSDFDTEKLI